MILNAPSYIGDELNKVHAEVFNPEMVRQFRWTDWRVSWSHADRCSYLIGRNEDRSLLIFFRPSE